MFAELITFTEAELDSAVLVVKTIDISQLAADSIYVGNESDDTINIGYMTASEYTAYMADTSISDLVAIADGTKIMINELPRKIEYILCRGDGTHDAGVTFIVSKGGGSMGITAT